MARELVHRGPDGSRIERHGQVGLVFNRLSIVDPVGGGQPFVSDDGNVVVIANGEIYNHRQIASTLAGATFRTGSDCEVLLHLYQRRGIRFLEPVRGIYAVVVLDRGRNRLLFARDRFGVKPLYFHRNRERVVFGSEIKALLTEPDCVRCFDWRAFLSDRMVTAAPVLDDAAPVTWFEGIDSVPAATVLEVDLSTGEVARYPYWRLPLPGELADGASTDELVRRYEAALRSAVEESGNSDAEVGLFLSGGIDSAAVAAYSTKLPSLHSFTALNGGTYANGDGQYAHQVAATLGIPNHQVVFDSSRVPTPDEWRQLVWLTETPLCGPEQFYKYELHRYAKEVRPDLKVMLLGQASDEFNGGYSTGLAMGGDWHDFMRHLRTMARRRALAPQSSVASWWEHDIPLLADAALERHFPATAQDPYAAFVASKYRDIQQYNCWHEDRTAAGNGIEARVPFLDHRVVEVTAAIAPHQRQELLWDKRILRLALADVLPGCLLGRPKGPFFYGPGVAEVNRIFVQMLRQENMALVDEALASPRLRELVNPDAIMAAIARLETTPATGHVEFLLRVVNAGLLDRMLQDLPPPISARPTAPLPRVAEIDEWELACLSLDDMFRPARPLVTDGALELASNVMLAHAEPDDGNTYVLVDGVIEYVIDQKADSWWHQFMIALASRREATALSELLEQVGCGPDQIRTDLVTALDLGVIVATAGSRTAPANSAVAL